MKTNEPQIREHAPRMLHFLAAALVVGSMLLPATPAAAQWIPCLSDPLDLTKSKVYLPTIPELVYGADGTLKGTVVLVSEQERMPFRDPPNGTQGTAGAVSRCAKQYVRVFKGIGATPPPPDNGTATPDPMPGPTLRAQVGQMVELTFLNQVNPANFSDSIDRGDYKTGTGCDETNVGYPGNDTYPNCFHGSSTANIHFHGTHTSPSSTADNVFIEIRPSPRKDGKPTVTEDTFRDAFNTFYKDCAVRLNANALREWPKIWSDLPSDYTSQQMKLITTYDQTPDIKPLWPVNQRQIDHGLWPQYYVGAYPYCFRLPAYKGDTFPPTESAAVAHTPQSHGAGTAEQAATHSGDESDAGPDRPIMMGQAPGTHWYHAHKHGSTAIDVSNGMTGAFIIEGDYDKQLDGFYGAGWARRQPIMLINQLGVSPNIERGAGSKQGRGPDLAVNGRLNPVVKMRAGEVQLWRILNTSFRAGVFFQFLPSPVTTPRPNPDFVWMQLAQDGVQFNATNYANSKNKTFTLASGNRADLLVKAPTQPGLYPVIVRNVVNPGQLTTANQVTLFTVEVADDPSNKNPLRTDLLPTDPNTFPLKFPPFLQDITAGEVTGTKKIVFATTGATATPAAFSIHTIDGKQFNGEVGQVVLLNRVEEWQVFNATTNIEHPFHIHINPFQVTEVMDPTVKLADKTTAKYVTDKAAWTKAGQCYVDPFDLQTPPVPFPDSTNPNLAKSCDGVATPQPRIWWDVFPMPVGLAAVKADGSTFVDPKTNQQIIVPGYFKMRSRFVDFPGYFVIHCHILSHEDRGMMTVVEVAPLSSPYSHH